jgi:hypothetical protein
VAGGAVAGGLVWFEDNYRHAALAATAARSHGHQTATGILTSGFFGTFVFAALAVFAVATLVARRRRSRRTAGGYQGAPQRARAGSWR